MKTIGQLIKEARKKRGLTRIRLSQEAGIPIRTLAALERGENLMGRKKTLEKILAVLDMEITLTESCNQKELSLPTQMN